MFNPCSNNKLDIFADALKHERIFRGRCKDCFDVVVFCISSVKIFEVEEFFVIVN